MEEDQDRESHIRVEECRPSGDTDDFSLGVRNPVSTRDSMNGYPPDFGQYITNHMDEEE